MTLSSRKPLRVLVAVSPEALPVLSTAFGGDFVLVYCASIATARLALDDSIDVVVAGIHFDGNRMFDLLRLCKASDHAKRIPFMCVKCQEGELSGAAFEAVDIASKALGGDGFIDLSRWLKQFGADQSYEELRNHIDALAQFRRAQEQYNPGTFLA